jgi:hypothetical protein
MKQANALLYGSLALIMNVTYAQAPPGCKVDPMGNARRGETIAAKMHVVNDGTSCVLSPRVGAGRAESISVIEQPSHGQLQIEAGAVRYTASLGYIGPDRFLVGWFGHGVGVNDAGANFRTRVEVDVQAKP